MCVWLIRTYEYVSNYVMCAEAGVESKCVGVGGGMLDGWGRDGWNQNRMYSYVVLRYVLFVLSMNISCFVV